MQRFIEKKINPFRRLLSSSASVLTSGTMIKSNIDPEKAISGEGYVKTIQHPGHPVSSDHIAGFIGGNKIL